MFSYILECYFTWVKKLTFLEILKEILLRAEQQKDSVKVN